MAFMDVNAVYRAVIDEVTTKSRPEFVQADVDEAVLDELRVLWEEKLRGSGVLNPPKPQRVKEEPSYGGAHYLGPQGYQHSSVQSGINQNIGRPAVYLPAASLSWQRPPTGAPGQMVQTGQATPAQQYAGTQPHLQMSQPGYQIVKTQGQAPAAYQQPAAQGQAYHSVGAAQGGQPAGQQGYTQQSYAARPAPAWAPSSQPAPARPPASYPYNSQQGVQSYPAYAQNPPATLQALGQRPGIPQNMSAPQNGLNQQAVQQYAARPGHTTAVAGDTRKRGPEGEDEASHRAKMQMLSQQQAASGQRFQQNQVRLPQQDGPSEGGKEDEKDSAKEDDDDDDEKEASPEKEELENFSDVASSNEEEENYPNTCISQFVKVQRTRTKWKCQLKGGLMHLNDRDYVFGTMTGDFQF